MIDWLSNPARTTLNATTVAERTDDRIATMTFKHSLYRAVLNTIEASGLHRLVRSRTRGLGAILMLHHVRPFVRRAFSPNRGLEITPEFLNQVLTRIKRQGYEFVALDEVPHRLEQNDRNRPFIAITVDDGYRDLVDHALPIFKRHRAPFTAFVTTGFADGTVPIWWIDMERAIAVLSEIAIEVDGFSFVARTRSVQEKYRVFEMLYWRLRRGSEFRLRKVVAALTEQAQLDSIATVKRLCLSWDELRGLAEEPLATIGAHTLSHPMLARHEDAFASHEIKDSRGILENELGCEVRHFAYPVGDRTSAGRREFEMVGAEGFSTGVTTRPGMLFAEHARHLAALPRLSLNGYFQRERDLDLLLSGFPFALINAGRKVNVS